MADKITCWQDADGKIHHHQIDAEKADAKICLKIWIDTYIISPYDEASPDEILLALIEDGRPLIPLLTDWYNCSKWPPS